jgi:AcrR family transcriptional regulator
MITLAAKRTYHHGNLRPALVAAALREIAHQGLDRFSLRGVARRAGVSPPAVYRHFEDKDDLLAAVAAECAERMAAAMAAAVASAPDEPLERFRATGIALVRFAVAHPEHFRAMTVAGLSERTPPEHLEAHLAWQAAERRAIAKAQDDGTITALPLDELLLAANALVVGLAHQIVAGNFGPVDDARATELAIAATRVIGVGLIPRTEELRDPRGGLRVKGKRPRRRAGSG